MAQQEQVARLAADAAQLLLESGGEIYRVQQDVYKRQHLSDAFGHTVAEVEADEAPIDARIDILKFGTGSALSTAKTVAYTLDRFVDYFSQARPDAVLVLGDRYEICLLYTSRCV